MKKTYCYALYDYFGALIAIGKKRFIANLSCNMGIYQRRYCCAVYRTCATYTSPCDNIIFDASAPFVHSYVAQKKAVFAENAQSGGIKNALSNLG